MAHGVADDCGAELVAQSLLKVTEIFGGLETYKVVFEKTCKQLSGPGQDAEDLGGREWDVKEEPYLARPAELAKLATEGQQVEVVDPDHVVRAQEIYEESGVLSVYAAVHPVAVMAYGRLVREAVKKRPERAVGEDVVEALDLILRKGDRCQTDAFDHRDCSNGGGVPVVGVSVPAHPNAARSLQEGPQATHKSTYGKVACFLHAGRRGHGREPIGDYYYSTFATHDSLQLPESAMDIERPQSAAAWIIPRFYPQANHVASRDWWVTVVLPRRIAADTAMHG